MTTTAYKIIDHDGYTRRGQRGETLWRVGETVHPVGKGCTPCGPGVLHAYVGPEVAALADPIHARYLPGGRLLEVEIAGDGGGGWQTDGLKRWTTSPLRVIREVGVPDLSCTERMAWAIVLCSHPVARGWAVRWLSGEDRSREAARAAAVATRAAWAAWAVESAAKAQTAAWAAAWATLQTAAAAQDKEAFERGLLPALARARAILAGKMPAEEYDR